MINVLIQVAFLAFLSQAASDVPVVTVCEALQNREAYNGKTIVVVGRSSGTDEGAWLGEDCESAVVTDGYAWPNAISVTYTRSDGSAPPELPKRFAWDMGTIREKLKDVQKSTTLKHVKLKDHNDRWMAMFGRFETGTPLDKSRGFGHLNWSPAQLIWPEKGFRFLEGK